MGYFFNSGFFDSNIHHLPNDRKIINQTYSHVQIPYTIGSLVYSIWNIKKFKKTKIERYKFAHMYSMIGVYVGAPGAFKKGRFFHEILFGQRKISTSFYDV